MSGARGDSWSRQGAKPGAGSTSPGRFGRAHSPAAYGGARASASRQRAREWKEKDELQGHFVISEIPATELKTKIYSLFLDSNEKLLNSIFV